MKENPQQPEVNNELNEAQKYWKCMKCSKFIIKQFKFCSFCKEKYCISCKPKKEDCFCENKCDGNLIIIPLIKSKSK